MINNKNILLTFFTLTILTFAVSGCKKYAGDSYDFSDTTKHYMKFSSTSALTFNNSVANNAYVLTSKNVTVQTRVGFVDSIRVSLAVDGGTSQTLNYTYPPFTTSKAFAVTLGNSIFPAGVNVVTGTITLKSATGDKYGPLVIGYPDAQTGVTIKFTAYRPGSPVN